MGGCRCTYRNCTSRSDGKIHMFHYPVFDKVRCHQWLTNAHKLEFLNLKVSQLKNRVVCQHHFRDDNFMNFKKDKLTFSAVPTENGPYCDDSQFDDCSTETDANKLFTTISLEDIENEYMTLNDKKANFSVKYGDFLTNCDMMDLNSLNLVDNTQIETKNKTINEYNIVLNDNIERNISDLVIVSKTRDMRKQAKQQNATDSIEPTRTKKPSNVEFEELIANTLNNDNKQNTELIIPNNVEGPIQNLTSSKQDIKCNPNSKVKIISAQKVTKPFIFKGKKLEPVPSSIVLPLPKRNKRNIIKPNVVESNDMKDAMIEIVVDPPNNIVEEAKAIDKLPPENNAKEFNEPFKIVINKQQENNLEIKNKKPIEISIDKLPESNVETKKQISKMCKGQGKSTSPQLKKHSLYKTNNETPVKSLLKNKNNYVMSPERMAVIKQKRNFNMKLRDIIETCLDKIDDQEKIDEMTKYQQNTEVKHNNNEDVKQHVITEPDSAQIDHNAILYLEKRMKKMEDNLLNKISQNSLRIIDLKKSVCPHSEKKNAHTQTLISEELHKKQLYQDISKYLSPSTNSVIYEELFINKYGQNASIGEHPVKRRKCR